LNTISKCRVVSQQFKADTWHDFQLDDVLYSPRVPLDEADALLALYDPSEELLAFHGPKLWFTMEPSWHRHFHSHPVGRRLVRELDISERAFYGHPLVSNRVPHSTFHGELTTPRVSASNRAAVACVSNFGGRCWFLKRRFSLRNRFILCPLVELYGSPLSWKRFRHFPAIWRSGPPANYRGKPPVDGEFFDEPHIEFLSAFKVAVCLENSVEPHYFTEKFVNAVRAGCIPVYHAHPSVKKRFLAGAKWIDPADFGFSPERTIEYALQQDQAVFRRINDAWLESGILAETDSQGLFSYLHPIIKSKLERVIPSRVTPEMT
jgi:hypothetical protein